jgi:perosamine synthetase
MSPRLRISHVDVRREDIDAMAEVLASGNLRQGAVVRDFEEAFAARVGAPHAVAVSSGTAALHLTYLALFQPGDEIIVPAFTFIATASMLTAVGVIPIFADVDPRTFTLSVTDAESRITERTRGIVGVHLFGNVCDIGGIRDIADRYRLTMVWDAAQALGSEWNGREVGAFPTATCYSFYPTKNITTGEGGMVVTGDDELASRLRIIRSQGAAAKYVHTVLGFNYRLTDFQAALGLCQLKRLDEYLLRRRENAQVLTDYLCEVPGIRTPEVQDGGRHTFNQYSVLVDSRAFGYSRDDLAKLLADRGIETAIHYPRALHQQPLYSHALASRLPVSEDLCTSILAIPVHPGVSPGDAQRLANAIASVSIGRGRSATR